jgi:hypothetical protein
VFWKLRTVIYKTADLEAARKWDINVTGVQPYLINLFMPGFDVNGCELGLDPDMSNIIPRNQAVSYWVVDNVETVLKKLAESGAEIIQTKTNAGAQIQVAIIKDPFGNHVGLIEGA